MHLRFLLQTGQLVGCLLLSLTLSAQLRVPNEPIDKWSTNRPDGAAPIGVMGDHVHARGELMLSYRFMTMEMEGLVRGERNLNTGQVLENYPVIPENMTMARHMLGLMYAPGNRLTLTLMGSYLANSIDLSTQMGDNFATSSGGLGDVSLGALYQVFNVNGHTVHLNLGVSLPTGDIDQRDATPMNPDAQLAYPMQLGSGTADPFLGATYLGQIARFSWGAQGIYKLRSGENEESYLWGNRLDLTGWASVRTSNAFSFSGRAKYWKQIGITGADPDLDPLLMPLSDVANSGRSQIDLSIGSNFYITSGAFQNLRLAVEFSWPFYQFTTGTQMESRRMIVAGLQYAFSSPIPVEDPKPRKRRRNKESYRLE